MFAGLRSPSGVVHGGAGGVASPLHSSAPFAHRQAHRDGPTTTTTHMDDDTYASAAAAFAAPYAAGVAASPAHVAASAPSAAGIAAAPCLRTASSSAFSSSAPSSSRASVSDLRIQKDLLEIQCNKFTANADTRISFPDGVTNLRRFHVLVTPSTGLYARSSFLFCVFIPQQYPFAAPRVQCRTPCLHPNINWRTGQVYLHLLRAEWKPVLSINAVIFSLQLLFLEPWPAAATVSATSSSMPPARPILATSVSASAASSASPAPSALSLASSKSATASAARQFDEDNILNLELFQLIKGGERGVFENMVRRTLDGGFFYGQHWPRNRIDSDDDSDEEDEKHVNGNTANTPVPFETLLRRVEENGRKAHISPQTNRTKRATTIDDAEHDSIMSETESDVDAASAPAHSPLRTGRTAGHYRPAKLHPGSGSSHGSHSTRGPLHRKRGFHKTSPAHEHSANPAAAYSGRTSVDDYDETPRQKRNRVMHAAEAERSTHAVRSNTSTARLIHLRRSLHAAADSDSHHFLTPSLATRKRPSPSIFHAAGGGSFSDGEYEDADADSDPSHPPPHTEAKDDGSTAPRRRLKKQYKPSFGLAAGDDVFLFPNDDVDDEMLHIGTTAAFAFGAAAASANERSSRTPSSTVIDLASFASFRPMPHDSIEAIARASSTPRLPACVASDVSQSPKRNVSDCPHVNDIGSPLVSPIARNDAAIAASSTAAGLPSFILHGRSSSRSINLFGTTKSRVVHTSAGAGLADLQGILASLPSTSSGMVE